MVPECVNRCYMKSGWGVVPLTGLSWVKFLLKERENLCDYHDKHIFFLHKTVYSSRVLSTCVIMGIVFLFKMWFVCLFVYLFYSSFLFFAKIHFALFIFSYFAVQVVQVTENSREKKGSKQQISFQTDL